MKLQIVPNQSILFTNFAKNPKGHHFAVISAISTDALNLLVKLNSTMQQMP